MTAPSTMPAFSVEAVACEAVSAVCDAMGDAREWGLADYPRHLNVGDSAIWLGERQLLRTAGVRVVASCDTATYSRRAFGRALAGRPVLLHGGGSFGDLWPEHQQLREQILADFPGRPVVQLAQSINFRSAENLERARRAVARHGNVTLVVRDAPSRDRATELFDARVILAPDMAFALGRLERTAPATEPLLHLGRDDLERSEGALAVADHVDWIHPPREPRDRAAITFARALIVLSAGRDGTQRSRTSARAVLRAYDLLAQANVDRGRRMLSRGRVVVTERLHGHILCVLMSIPHVVVADRYGKLRAFHETWTRDAPGVRWADSLADAQRAAQELVHGG